MDNIKKLEPRPTSPVAKVLAMAAGSKLQTAIVIGWDDNGDLYFDSSEPDGAEVNWLLDQAKKDLLAGGRE